jgi:hypothetical protein
MKFHRSVLLSGAVLAGAASGADAQAQYQPYAYPYPYMPTPYSYQAPATPPAWSYDPYTSGLGPCPQWYRGDPPCRDTMHPTYGQPSYWGAR